MPRLTQEVVKEYIDKAPSLKPTERSPGGLWVGDSSISGFYLRIWPTGHSSYAVKKRVGNRVLTRTIGPAAFMPLEDARKAAAKALLQMDAGIDPLEVKRRDFEKAQEKASKSKVAKITVKQALQDFLAERTRATSTKKDINDTFSTHFKDWLDRPIRDISQSEITERLLSIPETAAQRSKSRIAAGNHRGQGAQTKAAKWLKALFRWAVATEIDGEAIVLRDPTHFIAVKRIVKTLKRRQGAGFRLAPSLVRGLLEELEEPTSTIKEPERLFMKFMLFSGCRISEALKLKTADVDLVNGVAIFRLTKNGTDYRLPLSKTATQTLKSALSGRVGNARSGDYVFSNGGGSQPIAAPYEAFGKAGEAIGQHFSPSDLRRTWTATAIEEDVPLEVRSACLNHTLQNVTLGYAGIPEKQIRAAFEKVDKALLGVKKAR